jgi:hypothetical protein
VRDQRLQERGVALDAQLQRRQQRLATDRRGDVLVDGWTTRRPVQEVVRAPAPAGPFTTLVAVNMWVMPWSCTLAIGPICDESKFMPRSTTMSFLNGSSGDRIGDSVNSLFVAPSVERQFSGMVPHGLKKMPNRLGAGTPALARRPRGRISSSHGSATPTPSAPLSSARRDSVRGMRRSGFPLACNFLSIFLVLMAPLPRVCDTGTYRWRRWRPPDPSPACCG